VRPIFGGLGRPCSFGRYVFGALGNEADIYIVLFSPLSALHWSQNTWPRMTLNGSNGHFTLNFHYYELTLSYYLLIYCRVCLHTLVTSGDVWKRSSGPWSAEYLESAEKLRIFRRRYIIGTLTNKANISIWYSLVPYRLFNDLEWPWIGILH